MVNVYDDWIVISNDDQSMFPLTSALTFVEPPREIVNRYGHKIRIQGSTKTVHVVHEGNIYVPIGLYKYVLPYIQNSEIIYHPVKESKLRNTEELIKNIESYKDILDGIILRDYQLIALRKILHNKRCIIQMSTGSGKTEVICALVKCLTDINDCKIPTTLVIEPTIRLMKDIANRFKKYDIPTVLYYENRKIIPNYVNICHPISLGNDLEKNSKLLEEVEVLVGDECHHFSAPTFRKPIRYMPNLVYSVGVSASAISQDNVNKDSLTGFTYDELLTIGATGPLVMNLTANTLIEQGNLATPVLFIIDNPADEFISDSHINNWHKISQVKLESDYRSQLICEAASFFESVDRKVLILVRTKRHAQKIMKMLHDKYDLSDRTRASYGGGYFERYNGYEFVQDTDDVFSKFNSGEYSILIGTSHLYEGVDVPNLDIMILAMGGKTERLQIQGVGRVLRKSKTGKFAWIIDFNDREDIVLSKHAILRFDRYREIIGIDDKYIFKDMDIKNLPMIFSSLEDGNNK